MILTFSGLSIKPAQPPIEGMAPPPCPIAELPEEILAHILEDVAVADIGDFVRLAQVCKRLAYLVSTEDRIWRRVCLGPEFGFGGMHYEWQQGVSWDELDEGHVLGEDGTVVLTAEDRMRQRKADEQALTNSLYSSALYSSSWQRMFRTRPRIRFNGCYICTVNYIRSGVGNSTHITWNSPVHIVTYFRYLRFFRDGTVLSLLSTAEPSAVVHHLTKDAVEMHRGGAMAHLPSHVVQPAFRGRWRLSSAALGGGIDGGDGRGGDEKKEDKEVPAPSLLSGEGDLFVETEGHKQYIYRLELSLRSAGKGSRNNKLVWRGHYSYNTLTDDWGEFGLKNDKPFFFSRVKSYGTGQ